MKRNTLLVTIVSILMIFAFVSCSNNVAPEDQLGNISFADNSRALKTSVEYSEKVEELYWYYTATKADDGYTTGTAATYTAVKDMAGLKDSVLKDFSYGYWNIELRGFTEANKPTAYTDGGEKTVETYNEAADAKAEFKATLTRFLVKASNNNATAEVKMGDGATTEIEFGEITFTADNILATSTFTLSVVDTNENGFVEVTEDGKEVVAGKITYPKGKLTYTPNSGDADISGAHEMTFVLAQTLNFTDEDEAKSSGTTINVATYTLSFNAIKGTKTTIEGSLTRDENKGDVTINNVVENLPAITIKKALKIVATDVAAGSTTAKSSESQTLSYNNMTITVPADAVVPASLADGSAVKDGSTATADAAIGWEVKNEVGSGIEIDTGNDSINVELTLPVTKDNTELVTVSNYIGTGLDIPAVYHAGNKIEVETNQAVPTDNNEGWFYDTGTGYIYLYVKHASEFNIVVKKSVAKIENTSYLTLEEAFEKANSDDATITLLRDVTLSSAVTVNNNITLDMNSKVVTLSGLGNISIAKEKTLTVKNINASQGDFTDAEAKIGKKAGIGDVYYPTVVAALEAVAEGETVTMVNNASLEWVALVGEITLDLNKKTLSLVDDCVSIGYSGCDHSKITITNGNLVLDNKESTSEGDHYTYGIMLENATFTLDNVNVTGGANYRYGILASASSYSAALTIKDSTINILTDIGVDFRGGAEFKNSNSLTIDNSKVVVTKYGSIGLVATYAKVEISNNSVISGESAGLLVKDGTTTEIADSGVRNTQTEEKTLTNSEKEALGLLAGINAPVGMVRVEDVVALTTKNATLSHWDENIEGAAKTDVSLQYKAGVSNQALAVSLTGTLANDTKVLKYIVNDSEGFSMDIAIPVVRENPKN